MRFAAVFPGQGSQTIGMLADLAKNHKEIEHTFQEGSDIIRKDLWKLITEESSRKFLNQTENTQPVMLAACVAVWRVWVSCGGCLPTGTAGHSLGEYAALVASGSLSFDDAMLIVFERAKLMQLSVPKGKGGMTAIIGLQSDDVIQICNSVDDKNHGVVEVANFNSLNQIVISGNSKTVDIAASTCIEEGAIRAIKLPVSVPSHCSLMENIANTFYEKLARIELFKGNFPVLHNVDASSHDSKENIRVILSEQLYKPVQWVETILNFKNKHKIDTLIEFGPSKVLFNLNRAINNKDIKNLYICDQSSLEKSLKLCV